MRIQWQKLKCYVSALSMLFISCSTCSSVNFLVQNVASQIKEPFAFVETNMSAQGSEACVKPHRKRVWRQLSLPQMRAKTKDPLNATDEALCNIVRAPCAALYSIRPRPSKAAILRVTADRINRNCRDQFVAKQTGSDGPPGPRSACFYSGCTDFRSLCFARWWDFHRSPRLAGLRSVWDQRGIGSL